MAVVSLKNEKARLLVLFLLLSLALCAVTALQSVVGNAWAGIGYYMSSHGATAGQGFAISAVGVYQSALWGACAGACFGAVPGALVGATCGL